MSFLVLVHFFRAKNAPPKLSQRFTLRATGKDTNIFECPQLLRITLLKKSCNFATKTVMRKVLITIVLFCFAFCTQSQSFLYTENTKDYYAHYSRLGSDKLVNHVISIDFQGKTGKYHDSSFRGFYNVIPDTLWHRKKKNPQEGKDYSLNNIYKKISWDGTDPNAINGHFFLIEKIENISTRDRSKKCDYYLKDINTGDHLIWRVPDFYHYYDDGSEPYSIYMPEVSKLFKSELIGQYYYISYSKENGYGLQYRKVKCIDCDFFYAKSFSYSYLSLLLELEGNDHLIRYKTDSNKYYFLLKIGDEEHVTDTYWGGLITVEEYNKLRDNIIKEKKEKVNYSIELENVEKFKKTTNVSNDSFSDDIIDVTWKFKNNNNYFGFIIENKTSNTIKILWENGSFVNPNKIACGIVHKDVVGGNKNTRNPTLIPSNTKVIDAVLPVEEYYTILDGDRVKIILPLEINNKIINYTFTFKYKLKSVYPLLQHFDPADFSSEKEAEEYFQNAIK